MTAVAGAVTQGVKSAATSPVTGAAVAVAIVAAASVLVALHDIVPGWFEAAVFLALGHAFTASGVGIGAQTGSSTTAASSAPPAVPPPPPGAQS